MEDATKDLRPVDDQDGRSADAGDPGADEVEILSIEGGDPADAPAAEATASTSEAGSETPGGEPEFFRRELEELRDRSLRAMADFDNFRKRAEREREDIKRYALAGALGELLPVVDTLERAVAAQGSLDDLRRGIEMTLRQLQDILRRLGLKEVPAVGQRFDPHVHEAVMREEREGLAEAIVVAELLRGYVLHDRVLRPAMVTVAVPVDGDAAAESDAPPEA